MLNLTTYRCSSHRRIAVPILLLCFVQLRHVRKAKIHRGKGPDVLLIINWQNLHNWRGRGAGGGRNQREVKTREFAREEFTWTQNLSSLAEGCLGRLHMIFHILFSGRWCSAGIKHPISAVFDHSSLNLMAWSLCRFSVALPESQFQPIYTIPIESGTSQSVFTPGNSRIFDFNTNTFVKSKESKKIF